MTVTLFRHGHLYALLEIDRGGIKFEVVFFQKVRVRVFIVTKIELDVAKSYQFYEKCLLGPIQEKSKIYQEYGFKVIGSVVSRDWEVLAAILLKDRAKPGYGSDLEKHEVKSARYGNSFEYKQIMLERTLDNAIVRASDSESFKRKASY